MFCSCQANFLKLFINCYFTCTQKPYNTSELWLEYSIKTCCKSGSSILSKDLFNVRCLNSNKKIDDPLKGSFVDYLFVLGTNLMNDYGQGNMHVLFFCDVKLFIHMNILIQYKMRIHCLSSAHNNLSSQYLQYSAIL